MEDPLGKILGFFAIAVSLSS